MNFVLMMALTAIASPCMQYDNCEAYKDNIINKLSEKGIEVSEDVSISSNELFDITGINKYSYSYIQDVGSVIYNKETNKIVHYEQTNSSQLLSSEKNTINIYDDENVFYTYNYVSKQVREILPYYDVEKLTYNYLEENELPESATYCNYYEYFVKLTDKFPVNDTGCCGVVSLAIYLSYYDNFLNDSIIEESFDNPYISSVPFTSYKNVEESPGTLDTYKQMVFDETLNDLKFDSNNGLVNTDQHAQMISNRIKKLSKSNTLSSTIRTIYSSNSNIVIEKTKSYLDAGKPVLLDHVTHGMVAFGYDDLYVYVHFGAHKNNFHSNIARVSWGNFYPIGSACFVVNFDMPYSTFNNYFYEPGNKYLEPSNYKWHYLVDVDANQFGFEPQYFFFEKESSHVFSNFTISSKRLRCGYIEDTAINLSPCRSGAGTAYLELSFNRPIHLFKVSLSYWSDKQSNWNNRITWASIETRTIFEHWSTSVDLLKKQNLSKDPKNPTTIKLTSNEGFSSIKFYMEGEAIGASNSGRISIINMYLYS